MSSNTSDLISQKLEIPSHKASQIKSIIREHFKKTVLTWNPNVGGLLLKNTSVHLLDKSAEFNDETGDLIVSLSCSSIFFIPTKTVCLARLKEIQADFLVLNVLNLLDIMIEAQHIGNNVFVHNGKVS